MLNTFLDVREAGPGELIQISATLADAFAHDPLMQWLMPSQRGRDQRLRRLFALELAHYVFPVGRVLTTDDLRGANLELPPGRWTMSMRLSGAVGLIRVFGLRMADASRVQRLSEREHLQEPHYYIRYLGVGTRYQGRGTGTGLLSGTLERCDQEGVPAYIEASSERSAALYERLGFVHLGELQIPNGGPRLWPMRRPPAA
jgi:RimJ/RimL family protein N-acetyltransferase